MLRALEVTVPCCSKNSSTENWGISKKISEFEFILNKFIDPPPPPTLLKTVTDADVSP